MNNDGLQNDQACIIDGFGGQNIEDAPFLIKLLRNHNLMNSTTVLYLRSSSKNCAARIIGRMICDGCGGIYNKDTHKPARDMVCDYCGRDLIGRTEDDCVTMRKRIQRCHDVMIANDEQYKTCIKYQELDVDKDYNIDDVFTSLF